MARLKGVNEKTPAYERGVRMANGPVDANPYKQGSLNWKHWQRGYYSENKNG